MRVTLAIAAAALLVASGCTTRDRVNPLDPANNETHGTVPGFAAIAANGLVELRWAPLKQAGIVAYAIHRWRPGGTPAPLPGAVYSPIITGAIDLDVTNDSTYLYRLVARFAYGDSAVSPPDSATPGTRSIFVLSADLPGVVVLSPDARDVIETIPGPNAYEDFEIDRVRGVLWLSDPISGTVFRQGLNGEVAGVDLPIVGVTDVSVSNLRGVGWTATPEALKAEAYGPDLGDPVARVTVAGIGRVRVVEAGTADPVVWFGTDEGYVYRFTPDGTPIGEPWTLGAPVRAIALDQAAHRAWVVTSRGNLNDLYLLAPGDTSTVPLRVNLNNVADVEVEPLTETLWMSERGEPRQGAGRVSRLAVNGATLASYVGIEPYGITVEPGRDAAWVTDLLSNRVLELDASATLIRRSPPIGVPYGILVHTP